ncbi:hypothetical protein MKZ38_007683 [Zalerion maritima]|uniref:Uncharacterized protein n=1 Tax=Zalerion maritima TaxID=339359 RepID=A0AAD5RZU4_9PEZI|nr:hypothetical protein MKZ38_007683 [Zalerion maritima]
MIAGIHMEFIRGFNAFAVATQFPTWIYFLHTNTFGESYLDEAARDDTVYSIFSRPARDKTIADGADDMAEDYITACGLENAGWKLRLRGNILVIATWLWYMQYHVPVPGAILSSVPERQCTGNKNRKRGHVRKARQ